MKNLIKNEVSHNINGAHRGTVLGGKVSNQKNVTKRGKNIPRISTSKIGRNKSKNNNNNNNIGIRNSKERFLHANLLCESDGKIVNIYYFRTKKFKVLSRLAKQFKSVEEHLRPYDLGDKIWYILEKFLPDKVNKVRIVKRGRRVKTKNDMEYQSELNEKIENSYKPYYKKDSFYGIRSSTRIAKNRSRENYIESPLSYDETYGTGGDDDLNDIYVPKEEEEEEEDDEFEEIEEEILEKVEVKKPEVKVTITKKTKSKKRKRKKDKKSKGIDNQKECCIVGCKNPVTNRLRFSLRCMKKNDLKKSFVEKGWDKVCHYHYFSDLYRYKKSLVGNEEKNKKNKKQKHKKSK